MADPTRPNEQTELNWLLEQAGLWRPTLYQKEIARRVEYLAGDMEEDGIKFLQAEFELSWEKMKDKLVEFPTAKNIVEKKAQAFRGKGQRFYLVDQAGKPVPDEHEAVKAFDFMIQHSGLVSSLISTDRHTEMCGAGPTYTWWDEDHVEVSPYSPDLVHVAVNPLRDHDPLSAYGVCFERAGWGGFTDNSRYDVWTCENPKAIAKARETCRPTRWYTASQSDQSAPDEQPNPYRDRYDTSREVYPLCWFRKHKGAVYSPGGDDLVRLNRIINLGLTYLNWNMIWQMAALPVFEAQAGQSTALDKLKKIVMSSPDKALEIPAGVKFYFIRPEVSLGPFVDVFEFFVAYQAMLNQLSPRSLDVKGGIPPSGTALRIELDGLVKYRDERIQIYRPDVLRQLNLCIGCWNLNVAAVAKRGPHYKAIPDAMYPAWEPGQLDAGPVDYADLFERYERGIELGTYSVDDLASAVHEIPKAQASLLVDENLKRNAEVKKAGTRFPGEPPAPDKGIDELIDNEDEEGEEEEE